MDTALPTKDKAANGTYPPKLNVLPTAESTIVDTLRAFHERAPPELSIAP